MGWVRKLLLTIALLCLFGGIGGSVVVYALSDGFRAATSPVSIAEEHPLQSIEKVVINSDFPNVEFVKSPDMLAHVRLSGKMTDEQRDGTSLQVRESDRSLLVDIQLQKQKTNWFNFNVFDLVSVINGDAANIRVEIALPDKQLQQVTMNADLGNIVVNDPLPADRVSLRSHLGNVTVRAFTGKQLDAETDTGNVSLSNIKATESVRATSALGNVNASFDQIAQDMRLSTDTGNVTAHLPTKAQVQIEAKNDTGKLTVDIPDFYVNKKETHYVSGSVGDSRAKLYAQSSLGNVTVQGK